MIFFGLNYIVPVAMKLIRLDSQTGYLRIRNLFPFWIVSGIKFTTYHQSSTCTSPRNQVDYNRKACQWLTPPILADKGKQTVLDFVPFAGSRRKVTYGNRQTNFVGQFLQLPFPQTSPYTIAAARVRSNQQIACVRIYSLPHCFPPSADTVHRKRGGVVVDTHAYPTFVPRQIVYPVRDSLAFRRYQKIVYPDPPWIPLRTPFLPCILEISNQFFLLRINRNHRLGTCLLSAYLPVNVLELCIAVRMLFAFFGFLIRLKAVSCLPQQHRNCRITDRMPHCPERTLKHPKTFASPAQRRLRIASGSGFHQRIQVRQQTGFVLNQSLSTAARPSASRIVPASATFFEFSESSPNGRKRYAGSARHFDRTSMAQRPGLRRHCKTPTTLFQSGQQRSKFLFEYVDALNIIDSH
jgi:hypothetical protein